MRRLSSVLLATLFTLCVVAVQPATAKPEKKLETALANLWKTVLETPSPENPFSGGDPCLKLGGRLLAPFAPLSDKSITCTVKPGTKIFVTAVSWECSSVEGPPSYGADEAAQRTCAREAIKGFPRHSVTVDGRPVRVRKVETAHIPLDLPDDNILGVPPQGASSVAAGWVALLHPLAPGTHHVLVRVTGTGPDGIPIDIANPTTIVVKRGR